MFPGEEFLPRLPDPEEPQMLEEPTEERSEEQATMQ